MQNITGGTTPFLIYISNLQEQEIYSQIKLTKFKRKEIGSIKSTQTPKLWR
jgi:hypothetical protein